jgi:hypothetical protein
VVTWRELDDDLKRLHTQRLAKATLQGAQARFQAEDHSIGRLQMFHTYLPGYALVGRCGERLRYCWAILPGARAVIYASPCQAFCQPSRLLYAIGAK